MLNSLQLTNHFHPSQATRTPSQSPTMSSEAGLKQLLGLLIVFSHKLHVLCHAGLGERVGRYLYASLVSEIATPVAKDKSDTRELLNVKIYFSG